MKLQRNEQTGSDLKDLMVSMNAQRKKLASSEKEICYLIKENLYSRLEKNADKAEIAYIKKHLDNCERLVTLVNFLSNCDIMHSFMIQSQEGVHQWHSFQPETLNLLRNEKEKIVNLIE